MQKIINYFKVPVGLNGALIGLFAMYLLCLLISMDAKWTALNHVTGFGIFALMKWAAAVAATDFPMHFTAANAIVFGYMAFKPKFNINNAVISIACLACCLTAAYVDSRICSKAGILVGNAAYNSTYKEEEYATPTASKATTMQAAAIDVPTATVPSDLQRLAAGGNGWAKAKAESIKAAAKERAAKLQLQSQKLAATANVEIAKAEAAKAKSIESANAAKERREIRKLKRAEALESSAFDEYSVRSKLSSVGQLSVLFVIGLIIAMGGYHRNSSFMTLVFTPFTIGAEKRQPTYQEQDQRHTTNAGGSTRQVSENLPQVSETFTKNVATKSKTAAELYDEFMTRDNPRKSALDSRYDAQKKMTAARDRGDMDVFEYQSDRYRKLNNVLQSMDDNNVKA